MDEEIIFRFSIDTEELKVILKDHIEANNESLQGLKIDSINYTVEGYEVLGEFTVSRLIIETTASEGTLE